MNIVVVSFIVLCMLGLFCGQLHPLQRYRNIFLVVSVLLLFFIRAFVAPDSLPDLASYKENYDYLAKCPLGDIFTTDIFYNRIEPGFRLFMRLCSLVSLSFEGFLVVYGILWVAAYITIIRRCTDRVIVAVLMLCVEAYPQSLFVIRQHLAMAVFFLSFKYILRKDFVKYLLMIALAYSLHRTAIIAFPAYFLYNTKNKMTLIALFCLMIIAALFVTSRVYSFLDVGPMSEYSGYLTKDGANLTQVFVMSGLIMAYVYTLRDHIWEYGFNRLLLVLMFVGLIMGGVCVGFSPTYRLSLYYISICFLAVPKMCEYAKTKWMASLIIIVFLGLYSFKTFKNYNDEEFLHYRNIVIENIRY